jgi:plastocyanin
MSRITQSIAKACGMPFWFLVALLLASFGSAAEVEQSIGAIEGTVTYKADSKRPWRYGRYYIKNSKTGELAEAVVALRAKPAVDAKRESQTVVIDQENFQFQPETVVIRRGDSVKFTNSDAATHNVQTSSEAASIRFHLTKPAGHASPRSSAAFSTVQCGPMYLCSIIRGSR